MAPRGPVSNSPFRGGGTTTPSSGSVSRATSSNSRRNPRYSYTPSALRINQSHSSSGSSSRSVTFRGLGGEPLPPLSWAAVEAATASSRKQYTSNSGVDEISNDLQKSSIDSDDESIGGMEPPGSTVSASTSAALGPTLVPIIPQNNPATAVAAMAKEASLGVRGISAMSGGSRTSSLAQQRFSNPRYSGTSAGTTNESLTTARMGIDNGISLRTYSNDGSEVSSSNFSIRSSTPRTKRPLKPPAFSSVEESMGSTSATSLRAGMQQPSPERSRASPPPSLPSSSLSGGRVVQSAVRGSAGGRVASARGFVQRTPSAAPSPSAQRQDSLKTQQETSQAGFKESASSASSFATPSKPLHSTVRKTLAASPATPDTLPLSTPSPARNSLRNSTGSSSILQTATTNSRVTPKTTPSSLPQASSSLPSPSSPPATSLSPPSLSAATTPPSSLSSRNITQQQQWLLRQQQEKQHSPQSQLHSLYGVADSASPRKDVLTESLGPSSGFLPQHLEQFQNTVSPFQKSSNDAANWREHGKAIRAQLVLEDEERGGSVFNLSNDCSIERYYRVAERVLEQFLTTTLRTTSNTSNASNSTSQQQHEEEVKESYIIGNRLVKFLSIVLPGHREYFAKNLRLEGLRRKSQAQLVELLEYLEEVALLIDEMEYQKYILRGLSLDEQELVGELTNMGILSYSGSSQADSAMGMSNMTGSVVSGSAGANPRLSKEGGLATSNRLQRVASTEYSSSSGSSTGNGFRTKDDDFERKVARVVQVTEAFSDALQVNKSGSSVRSSSPRRLRLQQPQNASGNSINSTIQSQESYHPRPPLPPSSLSMTRSNRASSITRSPERRSSTPTKSRNNRRIGQLNSPTVDTAPDPGLDLSNMSSEGSPVKLEQDPFQNRNVDASPKRHSRIDLLELPENIEGSDLSHPLTPERGSKTHNLPASPPKSGSLGGAAYVPKLKQPPPKHSRTIRAEAAERIQQLPTSRRLNYDNYLDEKKTAEGEPSDGYGEGIYSAQQELPSLQEKGHLGGNSAKSSENQPGTIKTKIEERLERASVVQQELDSIERRRQSQQPNELDRWRTGPKRNNDDYNHALALHEESEREKMELISNRSVLHHFRGCVKCLID